MLNVRMKVTALTNSAIMTENTKAVGGDVAPDQS